MFEQVVEKVPELQQLEETLAKLQHEHQNAQSRVHGLATRTEQAREDDLNREAAALNAGTRPPKPQEPHLREQLESAQRDLEILVRRLALAEGERSRYVQEHHERLATLLEEAQAAEASRVSEGASEVLEDLLRLFKCEDDARALARLHLAPQPENAGEPERHTTILGPLTRTTTGGPRRGDLEGALRYLASLGPATEVEASAGEAGAA
jgi:chromosome segregation ATPase